MTSRHQQLRRKRAKSRKISALQGSAYQTRTFERVLRTKRSARLSVWRRTMPPKANAFNWYYRGPRWCMVPLWPNLGERLREAADDIVRNANSKKGPIQELPLSDLERHALKQGGF